jgi:DNA-binding CsgD family transcriptional regulator
VAINLHQALIDSIPIALVLTERSGKVRFANVTARRILAKNDGLCVGSDGVITCTQHFRQADLLRLHFDAEESSQGRSGKPAVLSIARPSGKRPFILVVSPIHYSRSTFAPNRPSAILLISDPESKIEGIEPALRHLYALTIAEARVAVILMQGKSLSAVCDQFHIRRTTARTHLRNLFNKLGVARQAELVAVLNRSAALMITGQDR